MATNNETNTPFPLSKAQGGTALTSVKTIIQIVTGNIPAAFVNATIPFDNTIPQSGEGVEVGTATITPKDTSNILDIYAEFTVRHNSLGAQVCTIALFKDSGADAKAAVFGIMPNTTDYFVLPIRFREAAGSLSATTYKIRFGTNSAGTMDINSYNLGAVLWASAAETSIYITEIQA